MKIQNKETSLKLWRYAVEIKQLIVSDIVLMNGLLSQVIIIPDTSKSLCKTNHIY